MKYLRELKDASGATYREMAKRTGPKPYYCGASTLSRAASGARLPRLKVVEVYARAAGDPADDEARQYRVRRARQLWKAAAVELARPLRAGCGRRLQQIRTSETLGQGLARLRARAGQPSLREIERMTAVGGYRVPRSTCQRILTGLILPTSEQMTALLTAFDVTEDSFSGWRIALNRVVARRHPEPIWSGGCVCPDGDPVVTAFLERRERDERIKRRTGQLRQDQDYGEWLDAREARAFYRRQWDYLDDDELAWLEGGGGDMPVNEVGWGSGRPPADGDSLCWAGRPRDAGSQVSELGSRKGP
ncbi:helix-turn-helix transcriptional regulator [Streptomyces sp. NPDC050610]|uniref:helix-turn-helix domain-containing protein n=1 Tax=Streptomyces sp. NPDC050610 TaxID=3157097 RepID=UPI00341921C6